MGGSEVPERPTWMSPDEYHRALKKWLREEEKKRRISEGQLDLFREDSDAVRSE